MLGRFLTTVSKLHSSGFSATPFFGRLLSSLMSGGSLLPVNKPAMPIPKSLLEASGGKTAADRDSGGYKVLANRYNVGAKLGSGNFGTVFLVTDLQSNERQVAR